MALAPEEGFGYPRGLAFKEDRMPETIELPREKYVIGIRTRTKNANEGDPATARIAGLWQRLFREGLPGQIPNKTNGSPILAVYTDYESDQNGEYSLTLGCEVASLKQVPDGMVGVTIPAAKYARFALASPEPKAIQEGWREVWSQFSGNTAGARAYSVDFEEFRSGSEGSPGDAAIHISVKG